MTTRVLFLCDRNVCRSQLAAAALRRLHPDWDVQSAGWSVWLFTTEIHWKTRLIALGAELTLDGQPKHWATFAGQQFDAVVAFSQAAADNVPWNAEVVLVDDPTPEGDVEAFTAMRDAILGYVEGRWGENA